MLRLDLEKMLITYGVPILTSGDIHCSEGWIQIQCPYCNDGKYHLGWNIMSQQFNCYACGHHPKWPTIALLVRKPLHYIRSHSDQFLLDGAKEIQVKIEVADECKLPSGTGKLKDIHKRYLQKRNFCPEQMEEMYNIKGTHRLSKIGSRIVLPIYWDGILVSWTARSVTEAEPRYLKCPKSKEAYPSRSVLYGWEKVKGKAVVVEGIFDSIRLGPGAVATMGLGFSQEHTRLLSTLNKVYILFDNDKPARRRSMDMASRLSSLTDVEIVELDSVADPAELSDKEADQIMKELRVR